MESKCSVCFESIDIQFILCCKFCNNKFHDHCIKDWNNNTCPLCRCKDSFTREKVLDPKPPKGFVMWAGKTRDASEEMEICKNLKNPTPPEHPWAIDLKLAEMQAELFRKLMTDKYGPKISYKE